MAGELFPVSWSKIESFQTCPFQYYSLRIAKTYEPLPFEQKDWGTDVHTALEHNLVNGVPLTNRYKQFQPMMDTLAMIPGEHYGEHKMAVDINLTPVDYDSPHAFARCIIDRLVVAPRDIVDIDYKTGKPKTVPSRQLDMSSVIVGAHYPDVPRIHSLFLWTQNNTRTRKVATRADLPILWNGFLDDIATMEWAYEHGAFPAKPSGLCGPSSKTPYPGCPVLNCPHNRRRDAVRYRK